VLGGGRLLESRCVNRHGDLSVPHKHNCAFCKRCKTDS
jgi:hypothetical protein